MDQSAAQTWLLQTLIAMQQLVSHRSCRVSETEQRVLKDITNASDERSRLLSEIEGLRQQFKKYQRAKAQEVAALDRRLRVCLQQKTMAGFTDAGAETGSR